MVTRAIQFPHEYEYIDNGKLEFILPPRFVIHPDPKRPELTVESGFQTFENLTLQALAPHLPMFFKDGELVVVPIKPCVPAPEGYELVNFSLGFFLKKNSDQGAYIFSRLKSNDGRVFKIYVRHDRIPGDFENSGQYQSYKRIVGRVGNLANERQQLIPYRIQIDEKTKRTMIWTQLLCCAVNQGYISQNEHELFQELKVIHPYFDSLLRPDSQKLRMQVLDDLILHFSKHRLYPYSPRSFSAYINSLKRAYKKKVKDFKESDLTNLRDKFERNKGHHQNSVPVVARTLGLSEDAVYRRIRIDKNLAFNSSGYLELTDEAVTTLKEEKRLKDRRSEITVAAKTIKSKAAIKEFLYRHKDPSDAVVARWLAKGL